ncbi:hypothetical protein J6590_078936 [Homalodisca vitripennis]|nr:hypothetical protein J6590_078936 [Homalodisca vitripennis]
MSSPLMTFKETTRRSTKIYRNLACSVAIITARPVEIFDAWFLKPLSYDLMETTRRSTKIYRNLACCCDAIITAIIAARLVKIFDAWFLKGLSCDLMEN